MINKPIGNEKEDEEIWSFPSHQSGAGSAERRTSPEICGQRALNVQHCWGSGNLDRCQHQFDPPRVQFPDNAFFLPCSRF